MALIDKLKIVKIEDRGTLASECVTLKVKEDTNLQFFALVDTTYTEDGNFSNKHKHFYKFYDYGAKAGDFVKVYTKVGKDTKYTNKANTTTHVFYWDLKTAVWNNEGDLAILYAITGWQKFEVN